MIQIGSIVRASKPFDVAYPSEMLVVGQNAETGSWVLEDGVEFDGSNLEATGDIKVIKAAERVDEKPKVATLGEFYTQSTGGDFDADTDTYKLTGAEREEARARLTTFFGAFEKLMEGAGK